MIFCMMIISCDKDDNNGNDNEQYRLKYATVKGAELGFSQFNMSRAESDDVSAFVTVDKYGNKKPVRFINERGDTVDMGTYAMYKAGENHLLLGGYYTITASDNYPIRFRYLIVDKNTETLWGLPLGDYPDYDTGIKVDAMILTDKKGNVYFVSEYGGQLFKINVENKSNYTLEELNVGQTAKWFQVSDNGLCLYQDRVTNEPVDDVKLRFPNGSFKNLRMIIPDQSTYDYSKAIVFDGKIHVINEITRSGFGDGIIDFYRLDEKGDNDVEAVKIASTPFVDGMYYNNQYQINPVNGKVMFGTRKDFREIDLRTGVTDIYNVVLPELVTNISMRWDLRSINAWMTSDALFCFESDVLYRLDMNTHELKTLDVMSCGFEIKEENITASTSTGVLNFTGLQYSTGNYVIGEISDNMQIIVYPFATGNMMISSLVRLN